jgi:hypothetical protein
MGCVHGVEDCVGDSHFLFLGLGRDRQPGHDPASLAHNHNWARLGDVKQENHESSTQEEVSEIANDGDILDQGAISQPHDNR